MATLCKLLAFIAVLLMPLGMQPAAAAPVRHHAAMPMQHCPDQPSSHDFKGGMAECTMVCSAALPAVDRAQEGHFVIVCAPSETAVARILHGLHPDTATPPPKRS